MSLSISIRFLSGRAHLHPWQTHHSEGKVEWPPSHWRLLRALVAVAGRGLTSLPPNDYQTLADNWFGGDEADELPISRLGALLAQLASVPEIWLPKTSGGHTRQFFPIHEGKIVKPSGSAVFDTFAVVQKAQPLVFHWPSCELVDEAFNDLKTLLQRMTYFGRAESWAKVEVDRKSPTDLSNLEQGRTHWRCVCIEDGAVPEGDEYVDYTLERRLAPLPLPTKSNNPDETTLSAESTRLLPTTKNSTSGKNQPDEFADILQHESRHHSQSLLLRCLLRESGNDMKDGLERPIGTRWVHYAVPRAIFDIPRRPVRRERSPQPPIPLVRFALNTATTHRPVLPPLTDTLLVADKFRSALLAIHNSLFKDDVHPRNLLGREENNDVCKGHDHAYFWPTDEDNDGLLDHLTVYCPAGFGSDEVNALRRLTRLTQRGGRPDLLVSPLFQGLADDFPAWNTSDADGQRRQTDLFVSATPYFCPLHLTHGRSKSGRLRPVTPVIRNSLSRNGIINDDSDVQSVQELVFDYAPNELKRITTASKDGTLAEPIPPRQFFPLFDPPQQFPPLLESCDFIDPRFPNAFLKNNPDDGYPFGASIGLFAANGTRFIRAMAFVRRRRRHEVKGHGRMFVIRFKQPRKPHPFAIGAQCHYGLGLFVPVFP